ncbi:hypothetical protein B0T10DRAFT_418876 [Thelonectria olida]|uniref:Uncharacterized protein n=1 Tax=Thelonectria olida TaxID=1576542 RepID=A0A9P8VPZ5_9HYPO|nr:hypothetical protein B0T10DRAFT_418876 [Thelonectria olida]
MLRMATAMKGSEWCEELLQSLAESGNIQMFSCDVNGKVLEISMQLPGKPAKVVGAQPIARYRLAHLNARCRHFAAEERSRREAMEVRWLLETEMGSFFMRMVGAIEGWLDEIQEHDRAAAVARYREKFMAAGSVDVE